MSRKRKQAQQRQHARQRARRWWTLTGVGVVLVALVAIGVTGREAHGQAITVWKSPTCGCCTGWVAYLREHGFDVTVHEVQDLTPVNARLGVPNAALSCHTAEVGGYAVEGHVPVEDIERLLTERPPVGGIAAPGMPGGSPGMESAPYAPYSVVTFDNGGALEVFAQH